MNGCPFLHDDSGRWRGTMLSVACILESVQSKENYELPRVVKSNCEAPLHNIFNMADGSTSLKEV